MRKWFTCEQCAFCSREYGLHITVNWYELNYIRTLANAIAELMLSFGSIWFDFNFSDFNSFVVVVYRCQFGSNSERLKTEITSKESKTEKNHLTVSGTASIVMYIVHAHCALISATFTLCTTSWATVVIVSAFVLRERERENNVAIFDTMYTLRMVLWSNVWKHCDVCSLLVIARERNRSLAFYSIGFLLVCFSEFILNTRKLGIYFLSEKQ